MYFAAAGPVFPAFYTPALSLFLSLSFSLSLSIYAKSDTTMLDDDIDVHLQRSVFMDSLFTLPGHTI